MELWSLFQEQILGMKWLNEWLGRGLSALGLDIHGRLGGSVQFFLYDSLKITVLLCVLIFSISYIQSYFPPERSKHILGRLHGVGANLVSALLGTVTPFCSCSSIPLFIGFTNAGLPLGVTFSFLISSPMVDLGSLVLLMSIFGTKVAIFYVVVGLALAVAGGTLLERLHMEKHVEQFVFSAGSIDIESPELTRRERVRYAREQAVSTFKKVAPYILVGVGLGAVIHNWIPESWIETVLGGSNPFGVVLAVLVGVPMYADIFGTIPVAEALLAKGAQLGTVLTFMMAVTTLSLPSLIMLRKAVKPRLRYYPHRLSVQRVPILSDFHLGGNETWDCSEKRKRVRPRPAVAVPLKRRCGWERTRPPPASRCWAPGAPGAAPWKRPSVRLWRSLGWTPPLNM